MKKRFIALLTFFAIGMSIGLASIAQASFPDVPADHLHIQGITYGQDNDIFAGYPDGTFKPDNPVNRAEFTKIIVNAIYPDEASGSNCFPDVKSEWFAEYICFAKRNNILAGYPNGYFKPAENINFAEGAKVIINTFGFDVNTNDPVWYKPFIQELGVRRAIPTSITDFGQLMTRGEMAEIIYRLAENITDKPSQTYESIAEGIEYDPYSTYRSNTLGFSIDYLETWAVGETEVSGMPIVYFLTPLSNEYDYQESVSVLLEDIEDTMTLAEYSDASLELLESTFPEFNLLIYETTAIDGEDAQVAVYTTEIEGYVFQAMQFWSVHDGVAYVLTYTALQETYESFEDEALDVFDSFEFL